MRAEPSRFGLLLRLGVGAGIFLAFMALGIWVWHSGWLRREANAAAERALSLTQQAHFAVNDIVVIGRRQTDKDQVAVALGIAVGSPIFAFDPAEAEARLLKLPWVASAIVERRLPDTVLVRLTERAPLARWQHDNAVSVIDMQGKILPDTDADQFAPLPLLVGAGAPAEAKNLLDLLAAYPAVTQNMTAAVRVGDRRWDVRLQPKIVAKLPESNLDDALKRLSLLISDQKILERDIVAIDLRLPDRLIIEGNPASQHPAVEKRL